MGRRSHLRPPPTSKLYFHVGRGNIPGNIEAVKKAIADGADVNAKYRGYAPLHWAETKEVAELLIAAGADVNAKDDEGWTPLHSAAGENDLWKTNAEFVEWLIAAGADVNAKSEDGYTPLYLAVSGNKKSAELLIAAGAVLVAETKYGSTPLHAAAYEGEKEIVEWLIAKGEEVNAKTYDGETTLDWATKSTEVNSMNCAEIIRKHGGKYGTILGAACGRDIEAVKEFLAAGADVNAKGHFGKTPLDYFPNSDIRDLLKKHGAKSSFELEAADQTGEELKAEGK